jgi:hypothetical protein
VWGRPGGGCGFAPLQTFLTANTCPTNWKFLSLFYSGEDLTTTDKEADFLRFFFNWQYRKRFKATSMITDYQIN